MDKVLNILVFIGGLIALIFGFKYLNDLFKGASSAVSGVTDLVTGGTGKKEVAKSKYDMRVFKHTEAQLKNFAEQIYSNLATFLKANIKEQQPILNILWDINNEEFKYLYDSFGLRDYIALTNEGGTILSKVSGQKLDLIQWLKNEFKPDLYSQMKNRFKNSGYIF